MSVATVITLGYGSFSDQYLTETLGFGAATPAPTPTPSPVVTASTSNVLYADIPITQERVTTRRRIKKTKIDGITVICRIGFVDVQTTRAIPTIGLSAKLSVSSASILSVQNPSFNGFSMRAIAGSVDVCGVVNPSEEELLLLFDLI